LRISGLFPSAIKPFEGDIGDNGADANDAAADGDSWMPFGVFFPRDKLHSDKQW